MADKKKQVIFVEPGEMESFVLKGIQIDQLLPQGACENFSAYMIRMKPNQIKKNSYHKEGEALYYLSLIHIDEPTRQAESS